MHRALLGLHRGEIAGLRWSAVDLDSETPTLSVRATRLNTAVGVIEQDSAKTASSARTLPIPPHVLPILRRARHEQRQMRLAVGRLWEGPDDGFVITGEFGKPLAPCTLTLWWKRSLTYAGLPRRRLHASRHTAASLLKVRGAPVTLIAAWLGHAGGGVLAMRTYVHTRDETLAEAARLLSG